MEQYLKLLTKILHQGEKKLNRTIDTIALFEGQMRFNLSEICFPLLTAKKFILSKDMLILSWWFQGENLFI